MTPEERIQELEALLARCDPPGYIIEPAPRALATSDQDETWVWDSCGDGWPEEGFGVADSEDNARKAAWEHFHQAEAERKSW